MSSVVFTAGIWRFYGFLANQNMRIPWWRGKRRRCSDRALAGGDEAQPAMLARSDCARGIPSAFDWRPLKASDASPAVQSLHWQWLEMLP